MTLPFDVDATWVNDVTKQLDAGELRRADSAAFAGAGAAFGVYGGIVRHGDTSLAVTVNGSDVVTIQPGAVLIPAVAGSGTGPYRTALPTTVTGNLSARHASLSRIDLVVFRQLDTDVVGTHTAYTGRIEVLPGTPSATPGVPALPSLAVELGRITVPPTGGGTGTVDSSFRTYAAAAGGTIAVPSSNALPGVATKWQRVVCIDTGEEFRWNGSSWISQNADSGWLAISAYSNAWGDAPNTYANSTAGEPGPGYRLLNGVVYLRGRIAGGATTGGATMFTLPAGFRPAADLVDIAATRGSTTADPWKMTVKANGAVSPWGLSSSAAVSLNGISFPIG